MPDSPIVAVGLLTSEDLEKLGRGFTRLFPIRNDDLFEGILAKLDTVEATPFGKGVAIMPRNSLIESIEGSASAR